MSAISPGEAPQSQTGETEVPDAQIAIRHRFLDLIGEDAITRYLQVCENETLSVEQRFTGLEAAIKGLMEDLLRLLAPGENDACYAVLYQAGSDEIGCEGPIKVPLPVGSSRFRTDEEYFEAYKRATREAIDKMDLVDATIERFTVIFGGRCADGPRVVSSVRLLPSGEMAYPWVAADDSVAKW